MYELLDQHVMFDPTILDEFPNLKVTMLFNQLFYSWVWNILNFLGYLYHTLEYM